MGPLFSTGTVTLIRADGEDAGQSEIAQVVAYETGVAKVPMEAIIEPTQSRIGRHSAHIRRGTVGTVLMSHLGKWEISTFLTRYLSK